ncbi:hypothetical protein PULV_a1765 [Pseudoalteromonas ulvae UL12]|uniref:cupin domain-containing protein n=1 Tax=Pseudoalteromonas ulvae TaxID=107327 RepID=UPI00186B68C4|nr:cupin domain-containing protein [Pseudoalteromonas ulvae]MBE0364185.1 hypothetical protein [Pseudoalteromonas ulvae UL12]
MYELTINGLSKQQFLDQYWQKKPLLIKKGFNDFIDPLSAEELAGLAMEECVESRIVTNHQEKWQAHHGPFEDFSLLTDHHATLLVQAVDHWHPEAAELLAPFRFIPNWRIDDLMISYSTPGGGVGPHLDQYDVFIIQGAGKRHWRVGVAEQTLNEVIPCKDLLQITQFEAVIDTVLEPGDILYIPPGCPHEGYATENALNYSVGFRAPNQIDMLSSFSDYLIDNELGKQRYSDPDLLLTESIGELTQAEFTRIQSLLMSQIQHTEQLQNWLGQFLSTAKHDMDLAAPDEPYTVEEIKELCQADDIVLYRVGGLRAIYQLQPDTLLLSINGTNYNLPLNQLDDAKLLTEQTQITSDQLKSSINNQIFMQTLTTLINEGYWYIE